MFQNLEEIYNHYFNKKSLEKYFKEYGFVSPTALKIFKDKHPYNLEYFKYLEFKRA